jgi:hypothetical protein
MGDAVLWGQAGAKEVGGGTRRTPTVTDTRARVTETPSHVAYSLNYTSYFRLLLHWVRKLWSNTVLCKFCNLRNVCVLLLASNSYRTEVNVMTLWQVGCSVYLYVETYEGVSRSFRTGSIKKYMLTTINTCWEATQKVMAAKLIRLTHKIAIQLHLAAESCAICSFRSRRPVRKLLDTPSYISLSLSLTHTHTSLQRNPAVALWVWRSDN